MSFHEQSFQARFAAMGDQAEAVFDTVYPKHHVLGLNRPPFNMGKLTAAMRYTPDRMVRDRFVEIQGFGRAQAVKIKDEKFDALWSWSHLGPVDLFMYDSANHRYFEAPLGAWWRAAITFGERGVYKNDGKSYWELGVQHFPTNAQKAPDSVEANHPV